MIHLRIKTLLAAAAVVLFCFFAFLISEYDFRFRESDKQRLVNTNSIAEKNIHTSQEHLPSDPIFDEETNSLSDEDINRRLAGLATRNEVEDSIEFLMSRGYVPPDVLAMYENYSEEILRSLGNDGDLAALAILAGRYAEEDYDKFKNTVLKSIVYGSISFAQVQADLYSTQSEIELSNPNSSNHTKAKQDFLLSLSWYEFIKMRGGGDAVSELIDERIDKSAFTITETDRAITKSQGAVIYDELSNERRRLGIGDYDNSVPPGLENFLDLIGIY